LIIINPLINLTDNNDIIVIYMSTPFFDGNILIDGVISNFHDDTSGRKSAAPGAGKAEVISEK